MAKDCLTLAGSFQLKEKSTQIKLLTEFLWRKIIVLQENAKGKEMPSKAKEQTEGKGIGSNTRYSSHIHFIPFPVFRYNLKQLMRKSTPSFHKAITELPHSFP